MSATAQTTRLMIDNMIVELLKHGTVLGHSSLAELEKAEVGIELFVQENGIDDDSRMRTLAGIALSEGITYTQLKVQLHDQMVARLRRCLVEVGRKGHLRGHYSDLLGEIIKS